MEEELGKEKTTKLMKYEGVASLTRVQAMEILKTIWPKAPEIEVLKAAMICHQYGLNPLMKHLFLIPFKRKEKGVVVGEDWVTVLGVKSNRLIAQRHHHYSYLDLTPRRMNDEEQEKILGEVDDSRIWAITKIKDMGTGAEAMGVGSWSKDEVPYGTEKGNSKLNMACIRSERQALDRQYPREMPQGVAVIDEEYISSEIIEGESIGELPEGGEKGGAAIPTKAKSKQGNWRAFWAQAKQLGLSEDRVHEMLGVTSVKEWTDQGKTLDEAIEVVSERLRQPQTAEAEEIGGEGFYINLQWLKDAVKELKWSDDTCKTFLVSQYKVSPTGTLADVIKRLTRDQAEDFVNQINERLEKQTSLF